MEAHRPDGETDAFQPTSRVILNIASELMVHSILLYAAFGWLAFSGTMHFIIDVVSQYLRGRRSPGAEVVLYYGLHSSFALGQVAFGVLCLWLARRSPALLETWPIMTLALAVGTGWLAITLTSMEYWEPRFSAVLFSILIVAVILTA